MKRIVHIILLMILSLCANAQGITRVGITGGTHYIRGNANIADTVYSPLLSTQGLMITYGTDYTVNRYYSNGTNYQYIYSRPDNNNLAGQLLARIQYGGKANGGVNSFFRHDMYKGGDSTNRNGYSVLSVGNGGGMVVRFGYGSSGVYVYRIIAGEYDVSMLDGGISTNAMYTAYLDDKSGFGYEGFKASLAANARLGEYMFSGYNNNVLTFNVNGQGGITAPEYNISKSIYTDTSINGTNTLSETGYYYRVSTANGNIELQLPDNTFDIVNNGKTYEIRKISTDANTITLSVKNGKLINGATTYVFNHNRIVKVRLVEPDYIDYEIMDNGIPITGNAINFSEAGIHADLKYFDATYNSSNKAIIASVNTFEATDVGKAIIIPEATNITAFANDVNTTITATIDSYVNATTVYIDIQPLNDGSTTGAYYGTNQYDAIVTLIATANTNDIGKLIADERGGYLLVPKLSTTAAAQGVNRGLKITNSISIEGAGKGVTFLKFSNEDDIDTTYDNQYSLNGFVLMNAVDFSLSNITLLPSHRTSTEIVCNRGAAITSNNSTSIVGNASVILNNVDITYDSHSPYDAYRQIAWGKGINISTDNDSNNTFIVDLKDVNIYANGIGIAYFGVENGYKLLKEENVNIVHTGSPLMSSLIYQSAASIDADNDTLTISGVSGFSFFNLTSQYPEYNHKYNVRIVNGGDTIERQIATIVSSTVAVLDSASSFTFSGDYIKLYAQNDYEGHSQYIHQGITQEFDNYGSYNTAGYNLHTYGTAPVNGYADHRVYNNCKAGSYSGAYVYDKILPKGWLTGNNSITGKIELNNCDSIYLTTYYQVPIYANSTRFTGEAVFYGGGEVYNCSGDQLFAFNDTLQVYNSHFNYVTGHVAMDGKINMYGGSTKSITGNVYPYGVNVAGVLINSEATQTKTLEITTIPEYTDNADALSNGLTTGKTYRTGDQLKIVH